MKKSSLFIISLVFILSTSTLNARLNPFAVTPEYSEAKQDLIDNPQVNNDGNRTIQITSEDTPNTTQQTQPVVETIMKPLEEIVLTPAKIDDTKIIQHKEYKYNLLSFVKINIINNILNIKTKYKLKKAFILEEENKIVFDFDGKMNFYTKRQVLSSHEDFEKIAIGAHPEDDFFRVVIQTKPCVCDYDVKKDKLISIQKMVGK